MRTPAHVGTARVSLGLLSGGEAQIMNRVDGKSLAASESAPAFPSGTALPRDMALPGDTALLGDMALPGGSWVAASFELPVCSPKALLAVGAESKGVFALVEGKRGFLSQDFGALTDVANYRAYRSALEEVRGRAQVVVHDSHPSYLSTAWARDSGLERIEVQHHHAHIASCMVEHGLVDPVVGLCADGAGCGEDKASWGCEVLWVSPGAYRRLAHLVYFGMPGGDVCATQCWRPALGLARRICGPVFPAAIERAFAEVPIGDRRLADRMLETGCRCPQTSSLGRLFDAMAFLLGICRENTYEAEAAIALQQAADDAVGREIKSALVFANNADVAEVCDGHGGGGVGGEGGVGVGEELDISELILNLCARRGAGECAKNLAADFHTSLAGLLAGAVVRAARAEGVRGVALSGGCMLNDLLRRQLCERLCAEDLVVYDHVRVSCGDAGLPVGQAYVAALRLTHAER